MLIDIIMKSKIILIALILILCACTNDEKLPKVITLPVSELTWDYAITGGEVLDDGGSPVIERGCIYSSYDSLPTFGSTFSFRKTTDSSGTGKFTSKINIIYGGAGYTIKETNYIRAYATNSSGTAYGKTITVYPVPKPPVFSSIKLFDLKATSVLFTCETGFSEIDEFYFCYSQNPNPTIEGLHMVAVHENSGYKLTGLLPGTTYYVRGYIKNESGFSYSPEISFKTHDGELTDIENNVYPYTIIGNQVWMAANLRVSKYNDGTTISTFLNNWDWSVTDKGACNGDNYNYYAVVDERKLCPTGWHMPSDSEWKTLEMYLGMSPVDADQFSDDRGTYEGGKLKMTGSYGYNDHVWEYPNLGATNSTGFSAQGVSWRSESGSTSTFGYATGFWTNTEIDKDNAVSRVLFYNSAQISRRTTDKNDGLTVRCIKD